MTPPMGWNSYDYYDTTVNEEQVKANADYMAAHLKEFGWQYIVVDIEWYAHGAGSRRDRYQYILNWKWMNSEGFFRILSGFLPPQTVRDFSLWRTIFMAWG